jgi:ring-1,2-phenylacetyl-CoA epoxidase subunit PaaD
MVTTTTLAAARAVVAAVLDPELPVVTIEDLGVLRDVRIDDGGRVVVEITPTYSGCPAMDAIRDDVLARLREHGHHDAEVRLVLAPAWTTDWITARGRAALREYGIAPPHPGRPVGAHAVGAVPPLRVAGHPRGQPVRLDGVQVVVDLPHLPRAVRPHEGALS